MTTPEDSESARNDSVVKCCKIAFSMMKGASGALLAALGQRGMDVAAFMQADEAEVLRVFGGKVPPGADAFERGAALDAAGRELKFMEKHGIRALFIGDDDYPVRLAQIASPPLLLYALGDTCLNPDHPVSVVGTRRVTPYGAEATKRLTRELAGYFPDLCVVSGLAYGVDSIAHATALECGVQTVGVLAHGLDMIYPARNRDLAKKILSAGGALVSQYPRGVRPYRGNFLERNRIVAGLSDATIVIESEMRGGAMSTARHVFEANRELLALPGRTSDGMSAGCNHLIRKQMATLITTAADLIEVTGWQPMGVRLRPEHRSLFPELDGDAKKVYEYLRFETEPKHIDVIHHFTGIPVAALMGLLSDLEFEGVLLRHPGNRFAVAT